MLDRHALSRLLCVMDRADVWSAVPDASDCRIPADLGSATRTIEIRAEGRARRLEIAPGACTETNASLAAFVRTVRDMIGWDLIRTGPNTIVSEWGASDCFDGLREDVSLSLTMMLGADAALTRAELHSFAGPRAEIATCIEARSRASAWPADVRRALGAGGARVVSVDVSLTAASRGR
ncbi:hypothetical protein [Sandaracinus amylolyticus]|uniref:Uncharacterized protein n=1 Tax=Sandaracinus amylolyticus TaxID=927083 RepID=A0A0F6W9Y3_9BACT|nr:hypothetical protein [Sandaracinus amylolyticus]AKF11200.1 hypothetical protein DB32_008349 [Sandaracinus amylolyticus]